MQGVHSREKAGAVIQHTLSILFDELRSQSVNLSGLLLKTSMALSGTGRGITDEPEEVAETTLSALYNAVPSDVPGIVFLSGGQSPEQATRNLRAIAFHKPRPWSISFSYARALQEEALHVWGGQENRWGEAQAAFLKRLKAVAHAREGLTP
jgi:fructose-bisphosphate aldolase class I